MCRKQCVLHLTKIIGKNADRLRQENGLNLSNFAKTIGMTRPSATDLIQGRLKNPTLSTLEKIAAPFGKSVLWLLTDHESALSDGRDSHHKIGVLAAFLCLKQFFEHLPPDLLELLPTADELEIDYLRTVFKHRISAGANHAPSIDFEKSLKKGRRSL